MEVSFKIKVRWENLYGPRWGGGEGGGEGRGGKERVCWVIRVVESLFPFLFLFGGRGRLGEDFGEGGLGVRKRRKDWTGFMGGRERGGERGGGVEDEKPEKGEGFQRGILVW